MRVKFLVSVEVFCTFPMKIVFSEIMRGLLPLSLSVMMVDAASKEGTPAGRSVTKFLPAMPRRGLGAGVFCNQYDYHSPGKTNRIVSVSANPKNPDLMDFVLVTLCGFCSFQTEILIGKTDLLGNRTFPAGAAPIFRNTKHAFSRDAVEQLVVFPGTAVVRRTCRADAHRPLFIGYLLAFFRILFP